MFHIRQNIIFSVMAHSILLAAALLIGDSSEIRMANLLTVSFLNEKESSSPGKQVAASDVKTSGRTLAMPKTATKTAAKLSTTREIFPKPDLAPLAPVKPQLEADSGSAPGVPGIEAQSNSSQYNGSRPSAIGSQALASSRGETGSAARGQKGQATDTGADASLKQGIRDALQANLVYPYIARKRRMEGTVLMEFRINGRGLPEAVRIVKGSSYSILDEAARETVLKASPFSVRDNIIEVPIRFSLRED